jgi:hypothetical protein
VEALAAEIAARERTSNRTTLTAGNQHSPEAVLRRSTSFSPGDHSLYFHALWVYFRAICVYFAAFWVYFAAVYRRPHERCFWDETQVRNGAK